jgi:exonuclease SbcD
LKIFHIADLHIGKQLNYYNLKENQKAILNQVAEKMEEYRPDVLLIAGDVFDKSMPSGEAYTLFDDFLNRVSDIRPAIPVCIIAGNHDSPERLNYASAFMEKHHIYISVMPPERESDYLKRVILSDEFGPVNIYLLPFTKPGYVRTLFSELDIPDYETAVREILGREDFDLTERNILVSHQFYQGKGWETATCDSEQVLLSVGGLDRIDVSVLKDFDYVALGHLHGPQKIKEDHIRYSGSPLKYSVSEEHHHKSITMVTMGAKGEPFRIESIPLTAMQEVRSERGTLNEILARATEENCHDFISVTLTDEHEPYRMKERLREVYDFILDIRVDNARTRQRMKTTIEHYENLSPSEAFRVFYEEITRTVLTESEEHLMAGIMKELMEDGQ